MSPTALLLAALVGQVPGLEHSAPWLGGSLDVTVRATPGQSVVIYAAAAAGELTTPYGTLELDRSITHPVASGTTDAGGVFVALLPLPSDSSAGERELHLQALVRDPAAPAGARLSEAAHLRVTGPRIYTSWRGGLAVPEGPVIPGGLAAVSALDGATLFEVGFADPKPGFARALGDDLPVFAADLSRAAVVSPASEVIVFEPHFGGVVSTLDLVEASRRLAVVDARRELIALETGYAPSGPYGPGRLLRIDLDSGAVTGELALPGLCPGAWDVDAAGDVAFLGEIDPSSGRTRIRFVDLAGWQVRGAIPVGPATHAFFWDLDFVAGQVFTTTTDYAPGGSDTRLSRLDAATAAVLQVLFTYDECLLEPAPGADLVVLDEKSLQGFGGRIRAVPASASGPVVEYPDSFGFFVPGPVRTFGFDLWTLDLAGDEPPVSDDPARLHHLDLASGAWSTYPAEWHSPDGPPLAFDVLREPAALEVALAERAALNPGPAGVPPELRRIDWASQTDSAVATARPEPYSVRCVAVGGR